MSQLWHETAESGGKLGISRKEVIVEIFDVSGDSYVCQVFYRVV